MSENSAPASSGIFKIQVSKFGAFYVIYLIALVILEEHYGGVNFIPYLFLNAVPLIWRLCRTDLDMKKKIVFSAASVPVVWILTAILRIIVSAAFAIIGWLHNHH